MNQTEETYSGDSYWYNEDILNVTVSNSTSAFQSPFSPLVDKAISCITIIILFITMVSLGCTMEISKIKAHILKPKGVAIAVVAQYGIMPLTAFALAKAFQLGSIESVTVLICGCCPGGNLSNIFALALKGDMNLRKDTNPLVKENHPTIGWEGNPVSRGIPQAQTESRGIPQAGTESRGIPQAGTESRGIPQARTESRGIPQAGTESRGIPQAGTESRGIPQAGTESRGIPQARTVQRYSTSTDRVQRYSTSRDRVQRYSTSRDRVQRYSTSRDRVQSIVMTTCSTVLALGMMPLLLYLYCQGLSNVENAVPYGGITIALAMTLVPCAIGIFLNARAPQYSKIIIRAGEALLFIVLFRCYERMRPQADGKYSVISCKERRKQPALSGAPGLFGLILIHGVITIHGVSSI
ncbi:UNVERIFIED_CONTAM: hypothetical protein FKN15_071672 [Acipenser sinensis]